MRLEVVCLLISIIMRFIKEIIIPGHRLNKSIDVEKLKRVVSGDDRETGSGSHIRVIILEFVLFEHFFVD